MTIECKNCSMHEQCICEVSADECEIRKQSYNKAIDDFKKMLTIEKIKEYAESDGFINLNNCALMIFDIAEQLKVGGNIELSEHSKSQGDRTGE